MKLKLKTMVIDFVALFLAFLFLILARTKMQSYMDKIQEFYPQIEALSQGTPSIFQLNTLVGNVSPVMNKYMVFLYLTPTVLFLLFILSQGINWQLNFNKKIDKRYLFDFFLVSLPFLLVIGFFGINFFSRLSNVLQGLLNGYMLVDYLAITYFILILVIGYFYVMAIASLKKVEDAKEGLIIGLKRFYPLFFIYLPFVIVSLGLFFVVFLNFVFVISESYDFSKFLVSFIVVILLLFIIDKYRKYFSGLFFSKK